MNSSERQPGFKETRRLVVDWPKYKQALLWLDAIALFAPRLALATLQGDLDYFLKRTGFLEAAYNDLTVPELHWRSDQSKNNISK